MKSIAPGAPARRVPCIADLADLKALRGIVGDVVSVTVTPIEHIGCSASTLSRVLVRLADGTECRLLQKVTDLAQDYLAYRTRDHGREVQLAAAEIYCPLWQIIRSPYLAVAQEGETVGLLMRDLTPYLFPASYQPLLTAQVSLLLRTLARMHAAYWQAASVASRPELLRAPEVLGIIGPGCLDDDSPQPIAQGIRSGWALVRDQVPVALWQWLARPADVLWQPWAHLPQTLIHGDFRLANLAALSDGSISAFDWAFSACAPGVFDLGWFIVTNGPRIPLTNAQVLRQYRTLLEIETGCQFSTSDWQVYADAAILCGLRMYLWGKAHNLIDDLPHARDEWRRWVAQLARLQRRYP